MFRRFALATTVALCLASVAPASAADIGHYDTGHAAPSYEAPFSWTGFYAGGNVGYGHADTKTTGTYMDDESVGGKGFVYGVQAGYNWQFAPKWVLGLETDFQLSGIGGSQDKDMCPGCGYYSETRTQDISMPWFGTTRARIGFLPWEHLMVFATGGVAYGKVKSVTTYNYAYNAPWFSYSGSDTTTNEHFQVGWTLGAGVEYAIAKNWSAKLEYLHIDLGDSTTTYSCSGCIGSSSTSTRATNDLVRVGVNYRF